METTRLATALLRFAAASLVALVPATASAEVIARPASWSKSDAILGGQSRLAALLANQGAAPRAVVPAVLARPAMVAAAPNRPDIFHSVALDVAHSPLDARWAKVANGTVTGAAAAYAAGLDGRDALARIDAVNRYVNARVRFVEDRAQFRTADRWSSGSETLARGRGDCEDYAIAKLQMLRRAGFADRDLYLSVVRDLVRRQDHAVLVVRTAGRFWVLDNGSDRILSDRDVQDYRPVLTFTAGKVFSHGYRREAEPMPPLVIAAAVRPTPLAPAAAPFDGPSVALTPVLSDLLAPNLNLGAL